MKQINEQQIEAILKAVYQTDIPAKVFDSLKKMLLELPEVKVAPKTKPVVK